MSSARAGPVFPWGPFAYCKDQEETEPPALILLSSSHPVTHAFRSQNERGVRIRRNGKRKGIDRRVFYVGHPGSACNSDLVDFPNLQPVKKTDGFTCQALLRAYHFSCGSPLISSGSLQYRRKTLSWHEYCHTLFGWVLRPMPSNVQVTHGKTNAEIVFWTLESANE